LTIARLWKWRYSIGSSMVMMWQARCSLMKSIIDAKVVDLPAPVGPVTRKSPLLIFRSSWMAAGRPSSSNDMKRDGMARNAAATLPLWRYTFMRMRPTPLIPKERSSSLSRSKRSFCLSVSRE